MYESFFGLAREPFSVAPDPRFLYLSPQHQDALRYLQYGLRRAGGFVLLTGEIGAGKTTVWRAFLEQLPPQLDVAYVVNPKMSVQALLKRLCETLQVELPPDADRPGAEADLIDALHGHLLLAHARGRRTLVVVDEAQALALPVLEQLRLLTNLVTGDDKLVQVLLIGQPELRELLEHPELAPVAQRIVARFHLSALPRSETEAYLRHRLSVAGLNGRLPFDDEALRAIHKLGRGTPRRINVLCDRALTLAAEQNRRWVDGPLVKQAAGEVFNGGQPRRRATPWPRLLLGGLAAAGVLAGLSQVLPRPAGWGAAAVTPAPAASAPSAPSAGSSPVASATAVAASVAAPVQPAVASEPGWPDGFFQPPVSEAEAWRRLARDWGVTLPAADDPCAELARHGLRCFHSPRGGVAPVQQLGRPGWITVADEHGRRSSVAMQGLKGLEAQLQLNGRSVNVPLQQLARGWRGDFHTLWRPPAGLGEDDTLALDGPQAGWLAQQLARLDGQPAATGPEALRARLQAFQLARGLKPDGQAGPMTLMLLTGGPAAP